MYYYRYLRFILLTKIVFCCDCSSYENIDIGIDIEKKGKISNIVSKEKAGIAHP